MLPELGNFALILAMSVALAQGIIPLIGAAKGIPGWIAFARPAAWTQFFLLLISFGILTYAFIVHDFSVAYVANNSNTALPLGYRISAVWGGHEGSLLLWVMLMGAWSAAVGMFSKRLPPEMVARVLAVMGLVSVGFTAFVVFTSNPFDRYYPAPVDGRDLNPLLQDIGLILHPPMLYMGYVGFSVAFAFAIAALLGGKLDAAWARWSRPWTIVAWVFLTLGIALGSWWAYYELGWGGWWFWDPVENASFLPWLTGTALMHSLAVSEKRSTFKSWTVLLAIFAFSLCLLGTFLVRSGVLTSVHAFASDPTRGVFVLMLLGIVVGVSLAIYAWRAPQVKSAGNFALLSRETFLLGNNVLLVVATATILLGTIYPLILDALNLGKISVGPPYFNAVFVPLMIPLIIALGIGPLTRWKQDEFPRLARMLRLVLLVSLFLGVAIPWMLFGEFQPMVILGTTVSIWLVGGVVLDFIYRSRHKKGFWKAVTGQPLGFYGMSLAHLGVAVTVIGITFSSYYSLEKDLRMAPGDELELGGYLFRFEGVQSNHGPNYTATEGVISVSQNGKQITTLHTQKRIYTVQQMPMTEAGIDPGLFRDLYVALGEPLGDGGWAVRIYYKPFVRWIWLGGLFMAVGGLLAASDRRYRLVAKRKAGDVANARVAVQGS